MTEVAPTQAEGFTPNVIVGSVAPVNSSAPISGVNAFLVSPSISSVTATGAPVPLSIQLAAATSICKLVFVTNGAADAAAYERLSLVAFPNVLLYAVNVAKVV